MQFFSVLASAAVLGAVSAAPLELQTRGLPTLNSVQSTNAQAIIATAKQNGVGAHGCQTLIATALQESQIMILANNAVPQSLNYPHNGMGSNQKSIGIFQQQPEWYPNIAEDMSASGSAQLFINVMKTVANWQNVPVGTLCQDVQKSEYPDRYAQHVGQATEICNAGGMS